MVSAGTVCGGGGNQTMRAGKGKRGVRCKPKRKMRAQAGTGNQTRNVVKVVAVNRTRAVKGGGEENCVTGVQRVQG